MIITTTHLWSPKVWRASSERCRSSWCGCCSLRGPLFGSVSEQGWTECPVDPLFQHTQPTGQGQHAWRGERVTKRRIRDHHAQTTALWNLVNHGDALTQPHSELQWLSNRGWWWPLHSGVSPPPGGWHARARTRRWPVASKGPCWSSAHSHSLRTTIESGRMQG